jgi:hypothetical protein
MRCSRCGGLIMIELLLVEGYEVEDISCLSCGERFWREGVNEGMKPRERAIIELTNNVNNFNKL